MRCPECVEQGLRSRVYGGNDGVTLLGFNPYYDEDGNYHSHDPNKYSTSYHCSNGHRWQVSRVSLCPAVDCDYGKEERGSDG